ncbi:MAG: hypothetical protein LR017_01715 [Candidatus Pacebacteria bacterium]|nr:hypothetical protein [Candidatus Paceibacterota bacterium]
MDWAIIPPIVAESSGPDMPLAVHKPRANKRASDTVCIFSSLFVSHRCEPMKHMMKSPPLIINKPKLKLSLIQPITINIQAMTVAVPNNIKSLLGIIKIWIYYIKKIIFVNPVYSPLF